MTALPVIPLETIQASLTEAEILDAVKGALFARAAVIMVDDYGQCVHHGDLGHAVRGGLVAEDADIALGAVLTGEWPGRTSETEITIADLTGIAAEDMAVAGLVWSRQG